MTMMKKLLLSAALGAAALAYGTVANAATISLQVIDNITGITIGSVAGVGGGFANVSGSDANFNFSLTSQGVPVVVNPDFSTTTIDASSNVSGKLTVIATQDGLTGVPSAVFANTFTSNFQIGNPNVVSVQMTNFINGVQIATATCTPAGGNNCAPPTINAFVSGLTTFSETEQFVITFAGATGVQAGSQISAVPEPATWGMMLLGFAGLAFAFRQSRRKVSFA
jgi:PEP-CTERM motif